jgi:hypothetical protein
LVLALEFKLGHGRGAAGAGAALIVIASPRRSMRRLQRDRCF